MSSNSVFISYKAEEFDEANWVKKTLETNGISCWMAPMSIPGGSSYASEIEHAIKNCKVFVLILSKKAQDSKWVTKELDRALNSEKIIMPFDIENFPLNDAFNFYLTDVQRYEAFASKSNAMQKMINDIRKVIPEVDIQPEHSEEPVSIVQPAPVSEPAAAVSVPATAPAPVTQPQVNTVTAPTQKKKSAKKTVAIVIAVIAAVILFSFFGLLLLAGLSSESDYEEKDGGVLSTSEELDDFSFTLEGVDYTFPCKVEKLLSEGWNVNSYNRTAETLIGGKSYDTITVSQGKKTVEIYVYNDSGNSVMVKDCHLGGIKCKNGSNAELTIANGISTKSTVKEILEAFGTPYSHTYYKNSDEDIIVYRINDEYTVSLTFSCHNNNDDIKNSYIEIKNYSFSEIDPNETNTAKPSYLFSYPLVLGIYLSDDISSGEIQIEGENYLLPSPITNFTNDGWALVDAPEAIISGKTEFVTLKKDGKTIKVQLKNFAEYQTIAENCVVTSVTAEYGVSATLAGGPSMGLNKESADLIKDFNVSKYPDYYSYSYIQSSPYIHASFQVNKETGTVSQIQLTCDEWTY